jgi:hypothetical protein
MWDSDTCECHDLSIWQTHIRSQNVTPCISCSIASLKHSTFDDTLSHLKCDCLSKVPSLHSRSHSLIPSFLTKSASRHYLPSLSPSFVASVSRPCHSDLRPPTSVTRSPITVSDTDLRPRPRSTRLYIIAVAPRCLFGLGPFGLHQSLYLDTARTTLSIMERYVTSNP